MTRTRSPIRHGTTGGYRAHYRHRVPLCDACRQAAGVHPVRLEPCGTHAAYRRHLCRGEEPCGPCRQANTERHRQDSEKRAVSGLPPGDPRHGTVNGYGNFSCRCPACTAANSAKSVARRKRVREQS